MDESAAKTHTLYNWADEDERTKALAEVNADGLKLEKYRNYDNISKNPEILKAAINQNGLALEFVGYKMNEDRDLVMAAVKKNGLGTLMR